MMNIDVNRRRRGLCAALALLPLAPAQGQGAATKIEVWKSPTCGCCKDWISYLEKNGFAVTAHDTGNNAARKKLGLPSKYGSCHTALVDGYVVEGHVPVREIRRLIAERPAALGIAVPGMPIGSPGMDGPDYGNKVDPYEVILVQKDGSATVYQSYR